MTGAMEPRHRQVAIGLLLIVLLAMFVSQFPFFAPRAATVSYSEFKALVKKSKVANLTLDKEAISGTLSTDGLEGVLSPESVEALKRLGGGPRPFVTVRVDDAGLVAELEQANVKFAGHVENTWLATLLSWIVPTLLFVGVWMLIMRRFGPQQGLMAIGKSKARVYVEHKTGVTFDDVAGIDEARGELMEVVDFLKNPDRYRRLGGINPKEKEIVAYHEAGHALVAESREHADRVAKISVIPRGVAALGYTQQQPTEDRYLMMRAELLDRLDVLLGGRVAEELIFGDVSTGAQDDLQRATDMARHMVARYGMSEALGLATFEPPRQALFLNVPSMAQREYSEETARRIDDEIRTLLETAHGRVRETLTAKREVLTSLAKLLIEKEVVGRDDLVALLT